MTAKKKTPTKKTTKKVVDSAATNAVQVSLPEGTGTQNTEPPPSNPAPIERGAGLGEKPGVAGDAEGDTLRRVADKAVWPGYGADATSTADLNAEQKLIDQQNAG